MQRYTLSTLCEIKPFSRFQDKIIYQGTYKMEERKDKKNMPFNICVLQDFKVVFN